MSKIRIGFPQAVAGAAFVVYALTLSHGVTLNSLALTAKIAGWDWTPMPDRPVTWLITLPLHLLPAGWIAPALNLLSAALAAFILGLLARSIELLPWNFPPEAKRGPFARLPVLLACAACGLEFSFWQNATAGTGNMAGLLLLTAAVWCVLEHRVGKDLRWLNAAAVIWGVGMAENWVMLLTLPLFVAGLVWLRGVRFFNVAFLRRMTLLGLAGFSIYALLPLANWLNPDSSWSFSQSWVVSLHVTKKILQMIYYQFWAWNRLTAMSVLLYFLVPTLPCLVRLKDESTSNKASVDVFQIWLYRALRVALLLACLWLAFNPTVGPREIMRQQLGISLPLLTFDYLNALGIAFLTGSLLFVSQVPRQRRPRTGVEKSAALLGRATPALLTVLSAVIVAGLLARSLPPILMANRQPLTEFGELVVHSLPKSGGIVLGNNAGKLTAIQAALARNGESRRWAVADLDLLPDPAYRAALAHESSPAWNADAGKLLNGQKTLALIQNLSRTNRIFYFQPETGHFLFDDFCPEPRGAIHVLKPYPNGQFIISPLSGQQIADNEKFWNDAWHSELQPISETCANWPPAWTKIFPHRFGLGAVSPTQSRLLAQWYSALLNQWGVELQRNGKLSEAHRRFEQSLALNATNTAALVNIQCCSNLMTGTKMELKGVPGEIVSTFKNAPQLIRAMDACGPFDEPILCCLLGNACVAAGWPRQALQEFERARELVPDSITPPLAMAETYSRSQMDAQVLTIVSRIRRMKAGSPIRPALDLELSWLEAKSWMSQTNAYMANETLRSVLRRHPDNPLAWHRVITAFAALGELTNALQLADTQIARMPDDADALNNKAGVLIQMRQSTAAIPILNRALSLTNTPAIYLNRAVAYLQVTNYAAAEKDLLQLKNSGVDQSTVELALAEIAGQRHDTNALIHHLGVCLSLAPPQSPQWAEARARLDALKLKNPTRH